MPTANLSPEARRELTLRALQGENKTQLADEYGVHRTLIYYYIRNARENVSEELPFWRKVDKLTNGRNAQ